MENTLDVKCPKCNAIQNKDIIDLTMDVGEIEGSFSHICVYCHYKFTVEFEIKTFVKTY